MLLLPAAAVAGGFFLWACIASPGLPLYGRIAARPLHLGWERFLPDLLTAAGNLLKSIALIFTGQKAAGFLEFGALLAVLVTIGAVCRGAVAKDFRPLRCCSIYWHLHCLAASARAMRERYLMPIQPLMVWCAVVGLGAVAH